MFSSFLTNATDWITLAFDQIEEYLSAPVSDEAGSDQQSVIQKNVTSLGQGLLATVVRVLSVSPLDAFNHAKAVVEVSQSATNQVLAGNYSHALELIREHSEAVVNWFNFSEFQLKLIREFSLILLGNLVLLLIAWRIYGSRISSRFLRSRGGRRVIEELRESVSELELPEDYNFKYK